MPEKGPRPVALNEEQELAAGRLGQDVCVVAGPGSGKTRVLVERFAWLAGRGADPERILAITFTEKAATELKERLAAHFAAEPELRRKVERAQISTIHGFCHAILREHAIEAGLDPLFEILDDFEAAALRGEAMRQALDEIARRRPRDFLRLAEVWPAARMDESLLSAFEAMRAAGKIDEALRRLEDIGAAGRLRSRIAGLVSGAVNAASSATTPAAVRRLGLLRDLQRDLDHLSPLDLCSRLKIDLKGAAAPVSAAVKAAREASDELLSAWVLQRFLPQRELLLEILRHFRDLARQKRRSTGLLDFSDLEEFTLDLLRSHEPVRRAVSERFEYILLDELQDTNPIQWEIIRLVRRPERFFAVGDVNQSIYGFRHAEPGLFKQYEQSISDRGWTVDRLARNYRSRPEILSAVSRILADPPQPGIEPHELRPAAAFSETGPPYVELLCANRTEDPDTEVMHWLAARLRELYGSPLSSGRPARFDDMAVFVRNTNSFAAAEDAFNRFSIPYLVAGGKTFFDTQEVVDLVNLLRALARPEDEIALFSLLRSPFFGRSDEELLQARIGGVLAAPEESGLLRGLREALSVGPASLVLARRIDETGYASRLSPPQSANVEKFLSLLDRIEGRFGRDPAAVLERIEKLKGSAAEASAPALEAGDAVRLMTIHKAKGLEFPIVAVAALEKGERHDSEAALFHPDCGLGFRWLLENGQKIDDLFMAKAREKLKEKNSLERDRLLYVALTRAEERLILSFTYGLTRKGNPQLASWPRLVLQRLGLDLPPEPGGQSRCGLAVLTRVSGAPPVPLGPGLQAPPPQPELGRLEPPREAPAEIAVTALTTFVQCPRRYLLESVLDWPLPPGQGSGAMALGTEVHEFLAGLRSDISGEARALAQAFENSDLARRAARARLCRREMDFLVSIEDTLVRGQVDLWFDEGAGPVLVDYKTDRYLGEARLRGYEFQMRLYAAALRQLTGQAVREAWLFPLREPSPHPVDVSPAALDQALDVLRQWREAEQSGAFPIHETPDCRWCPYASGPCPVPRPAPAGL